MSSSSHLDKAQAVFNVEIAALQCTRERLDGAFDRAVEALKDALANGGKILNSEDGGIKCVKELLKSKQARDVYFDKVMTAIDRPPRQLFIQVRVKRPAAVSGSAQVTSKSQPLVRMLARLPR